MTRNSEYIIPYSPDVKHIWEFKEVISTPTLTYTYTHIHTYIHTHTHTHTHTYIHTIWGNVKPKFAVYLGSVSTDLPVKLVTVTWQVTYPTISSLCHTTECSQMIGALSERFLKLNGMNTIYVRTMRNSSCICIWLMYVIKLEIQQCCKWEYFCIVLPSSIDYRLIQIVTLLKVWSAAVYSIIIIIITKKLLLRLVLMYWM
jgi:hypothetical protein